MTSPFRRGVNLSHWFAQVPAAPRGNTSWDTYWVGDDDLDQIAQAGFDHVRVPFDLASLTAADPRGGRDSAVERVLTGVGRAMDRGLGVLVDAHPEEATKQQLRDSDAAVDDFCSGWAAIATGLAGLGPASVRFEPLNEPSFWDPQRWQEVQGRLQDVISTSAAGTVVLSCGDGYSQIEEMVKLPGETVSGGVVAFHLYEPMAITHQGAHWSPDWLRDLRGVDYPLDRPISSESARAFSPDQREQVAAVRDAGWSRAVYVDLIGRAVEWASAAGVELACTEFGILRDHAMPGARVRWLRDLRDVFEDCEIGWTAWDYAGDFGLARTAAAPRMFDSELLSALGLGGSRR